MTRINEVLLYVGHVSPGAVTADAERQAIINHLEANAVDLLDLQVAGADGPNVNTGWKGGPGVADSSVAGAPARQTVAVVSQRSGDDVLFLAVEDSPEIYFLFLLGSSPPKRFYPSPDSDASFPRRHLCF